MPQNLLNRGSRGACVAGGGGDAERGRGPDATRHVGLLGKRGLDHGSFLGTAPWGTRISTEMSLDGNSYVVTLPEENDNVF